MTIKVLGHRGANDSSFYENSMEALLEGLQSADGLETDAVRTRDNDVFLVHDTVFIEKVEYELSRHLSPASKEKIGAQRLDQLSTADARALELKNGGTLSELAVLLKKAAAYPDCTLNLELKGEDAGTAVVKIVQQAVAEGLIRKDQVIVSSFNHGQLLQVRQLDPEIKIGILFSLEAQPTGQQLHPWSVKDKGCYIPFRASYLDEQIVRDIRPDFMNVDETVVRAENIAEMRKRFPDMKLMIWALKEPRPADNISIVQKLKNPEIGPYVHSVISNYPREMVVMLEKEKIIPQRNRNVEKMRAASKPQL